MKTDRGFTLVEMMITIAVTMLLLVAVYAAVNSVQRSSSGIERKVTAQLDIKPALDLMALEISMASYNPTYATGIWVNPPGASGECVAQGTQNYKGIPEAATSSMTVEMDICGTGASPDGIVGAVGSNGGQNEIIRYNYDSANQFITRSTNCGTAQPFLGAASGNTRAVRVINNTLGLALFRYFNGTGTEIASTSLPGSIPDIRRIDITVAVETEDIDPNTGQRRRLIYSTSAIPRNHAISQ